MHPLLRVHFCCEFYINGVGRWLAAAEEINVLIVTFGYNKLKIYATVGTGLAPVRNKSHIKSNRRTTARVVPTVVRIF